MKLLHWPELLARFTTRDALIRAEDALAIGDYESVEQLLVPYLSEQPDNTQAYMLLGRAALFQEAWIEAIEIFWKVTEINPHEPWVWALLGYATLQAGQLKDSLATLQYARDLDPTNEAILECLLTLAQRI